MSNNDELFDVELDTHGYGQPPTSKASTFGDASAHAKTYSYNFEGDGIEPNTVSEHSADNDNDNMGSEA